MNNNFNTDINKKIYKKNINNYFEEKIKEKNNKINKLKYDLILFNIILNKINIKDKLNLNTFENINLFEL